jgi:hypothetical protein
MLIPLFVGCIVLLSVFATAYEEHHYHHSNHHSNHHRRAQKKIDTSKFSIALKQLDEAANLVYQRYEFHRQDLFQFFIESSNMPQYAWDLIKYKLAEKIVRGDENEQYLMIFGGTSVTAGHDNYYNQSYPFVFERRLKSAFETLGIKLLVHNIAQGANNCRPSDHCYNAMGGDQADFMSWEQSFNCGRSRDVMEFMARYAYWNGAVMYYVASGGFMPDSCAPSSDKIPWICEEWTPESAGIETKYRITAENATAYRLQQENWYNDGNSVSRFTNQVYGGLYKAVGPHGYSVWGHSSSLCNNGKGCNALDVKGDCYEKGGPHWMTKEASYFAMDPNARGKSWHPSAGMHLMRGELLAYNYAHIIADTLYTIQQDLSTNSSFAANSTRLQEYYHEKWQELRVPIPEIALHSRSEETKVLPTCFTNFRPHHNPSNLLSNIVLGTPEGWSLKEFSEQQNNKFAYGDARPFYEAVGKDKEIHFRIGGVRDGVVRVCGYSRKESLAHTVFSLDPNYAFPPDKANKDITYVPTDKRVVLSVKDGVGDECWRLGNIPNGGDHVLSLRTEPSNAMHMTSISHVVIF